MTINHLSRTYISLLFLLIAIVIGVSIIVIPILHYAFFFTFDQARDALWVKNQIDFRQPSLIGPWGSLTGVFFGPLWFWLLIVPYLISGGNPVAFTLFNAFIVCGTLLSGAYLLRKYSSLTAYFFVIIGFLSPHVHTMASSAFSQHLLPAFTFFSLFGLTRLYQTSKPVYLYMAVFFASLLFHAEPPLFLFSLPAIGTVSYLAQRKKHYFGFKIFFFTLLFFLLPFLPTLLFEVRHDFLQLKAVLDYVQGENKSLGDILPFSQRLVDRPAKFFSIFEKTIIQQSLLAGTILCTIIYFFWKKNKDTFLHSFWVVSCIYILSLFIIFLIYPPELKLFYLDGLTILFILFVGAVFAFLWKYGNYGKLTVVIFFIVSFIINIKPQQFVESYSTQFSNYQKDTSIFKTQISVVDWIYTDASGKGFRVYTYQPAVYDYPYQYLFLWHGVKKYGYLPEEFTYLPNKPEYVPRKSELLDLLKNKIKTSEDFFYLIIEPGMYENRTEEWLTNFPYETYPLLDQTSFPDKTRIEKRQAK